jgi:hypothetical protein
VRLQAPMLGDPAHVAELGDRYVDCRQAPIAYLARDLIDPLLLSAVVANELFLYAGDEVGELDWHFAFLGGLDQYETPLLGDPVRGTGELEDLVFAKVFLGRLPPLPKMFVNHQGYGFEVLNESICLAEPLSSEARQPVAQLGSSQVTGLGGTIASPFWSETVTLLGLFPCTFTRVPSHSV